MPKLLTLLWWSFCGNCPSGDGFRNLGQRRIFLFDDALVEADEDVLERLGDNFLTSLLPFARLKLKKSSLLGSWWKRPDHPGWSLYGPQDIYTKMRQTLKWLIFEVDGKVYKNSFVTYENPTKTIKRMRKSKYSFLLVVRKHQKTLLLSTYLAQVKSEKPLQIWEATTCILTTLGWEVDRYVSDRQIDLIMKGLAQSSKIQTRGHQRPKNDLLPTEVGLDSALNPDVTIDDAWHLVMKSVAPLGEEYSK